MLIDIHERRIDGTPGFLWDTVDRQPIRKAKGDWVVFDGEEFPVLTGVRPMICVPAWRLALSKQTRFKGGNSK